MVPEPAHISIRFLLRYLALLALGGWVQVGAVESRSADPLERTAQWLPTGASITPLEIPGSRIPSILRLGPWSTRMRMGPEGVICMG